MIHCAVIFWDLILSYNIYPTEAAPTMRLTMTVMFQLDVQLLECTRPSVDNMSI